MYLIYTSIESVVKTEQATTSMIFKGIDQLFMNPQLLEEALLEIEGDDKKLMTEFVDLRMIMSKTKLEK